MDAGDEAHLGLAAAGPGELLQAAGCRANQPQTAATWSSMRTILLGLPLVFKLLTLWRFPSTRSTTARTAGWPAGWRGGEKDQSRARYPHRSDQCRDGGGRKPIKALSAAATAQHWADRNGLAKTTEGTPSPDVRRRSWTQNGSPYVE